MAGNSLTGKNIVMKGGTTWLGLSAAKSTIIGFSKSIASCYVNSGARVNVIAVDGGWTVCEGQF